MAVASPGIIIMIILSCVAQVAGVILLPLTRGLTQPIPTVAAAIAFLIGIGLMARILHSGVNLSVLIPILSASVPLSAVAVGVLAFGEAVSIPKVSALVGACILVGIANTF